MERETLELIIGGFVIVSFCYLGLAVTLYYIRNR